jgi:hypothetical protein
MKFIRAEDGFYYNYSKLILLHREKYGDHEVLTGLFVGFTTTIRLCVSYNIPYGIDTYLEEHDLEMNV